MIPPAKAERYKNHRFSGDIISHGVWLYYRFTLSYRDVQELLLERGIAVSHEAIRQWCGKFGQDYSNQLRRLKNSEAHTIGPSERRRAKSTSIRHHSGLNQKLFFTRRNRYEPTHSSPFPRTTHVL